MVKLTLDFIARRTSGYTKKKREESMDHYLRRLTHLYLEDKHIDDIGDDLASCPHLAVLYLYDNELRTIPNLSQNPLLTHIYIQNNCITTIDNLTSLRKLTKLYIGGNSIAVVEGLQSLTGLMELHIENQKLGPGEKLLFDQRSIKAISGTLSVLNVSGNHLTSLSDLECLRELTQLFATDNHLTDMKEMAQLTSSWRRLTRIDLANNPICQRARYRDRIIVMAPHLEIFDGKEVTEMAKQFLKNWQANKEAVKQKMLTRQSSTNLNSYGGGDTQMVALQQPARSAYIMPALPHTHFSRILARANTLVAAPPSGKIAPRRTMSDIPEKGRYLNTYSTYCHDTRPNRSYHVSLLNIDSNYANDVNP